MKKAVLFFVVFVFSSPFVSTLLAEPIVGISKVDSPAPSSAGISFSENYNQPQSAQVSSTLQYADEKDKAMTDAISQNAANDKTGVNTNVQSLRDERSREMPYLDKIFIRSSITTERSQRRNEFLQGGPKTLQDLIRRALETHTQAKASRENINLYNRRMIVALRKLFPDITFDFNSREGTQNSYPYRGTDYHISLRQPLYKGGMLWNAFLQERASLEAAKKQYDKTIAELVFDLSKSYFEYQRAEQTVKEYQSLVAKMKKYADLTEQKFQEKLISEMERLNVQSIYSQMNFDLEDANQEFEIAKLELQKFLDLEVEDSIQVESLYNIDGVLAYAGDANAALSASGQTANVLGDDTKPPELPKLIDLSYGYRPELQVEAARLQAARLGERIKWGELLPQAYLTYKFGEFGEAYTADGATQQSWYKERPGYKTRPDLKKEWQIMLEVNWNIGGNRATYSYDNDNKAPALTTYGGADKSKVKKHHFSLGILDGLDAFVNLKQAEVEKLNQIVELEKTEKQVLQDVKTAYYSYQKASIQTNSTVKRLQYRKRLRDYTEHRLGKKEVEVPEYMQSEVDLVKEKRDLHQAIEDYLAAQASLNHAVGIQDLLAYWRLNAQQQSQQ